MELIYVMAFDAPSAMYTYVIYINLHVGKKLCLGLSDGSNWILWLHLADFYYIINSYFKIK